MMRLTIGIAGTPSGGVTHVGILYGGTKGTREWFSGYDIFINDLRRGEFGELTPYLDRVTELTVVQLMEEERRDLDFLHFFPEVTKMELYSSLEDMSGLCQLKKLESLELGYEGRRPAPMHVLGELTSLRTLHLNYAWGRGVESIANLEKLTEVRFVKYPCNTVEIMANWQSLRQVTLWFGSLERLKGLPQSVEELDLHHYRKLSGFHDLPAESRLKNLTVSCCSKITSLDGLDNCPDLKQLRFDEGRFGPFRSLEPLRHLTDLEFIRLPVGSVDQSADIDALYGLRNLKTVMIDEAVGLDEHRLLLAAPQCEVAVFPNPGGYTPHRYSIN